jgi:hypothetical protein
VIRHPSENFIKYLMTSGHQQADNDGWVAMMVTNLGYPPPDMQYLSWLRMDLDSKLPADFDPTNRYHAASRRFMRSEGILGMHTRDKAVGEANLTVTNLRVRPVIESLLLGRLDPKDIAKKVNSKMATFYTHDGIDAYRHYYWQVSILRVEDWAVLLEQYDHQRANALAIVQVGAAMALHKTGFQQQIDSKSMLRTMQEALFFDFQEWRTKKHGSERSKAMASLAKSAVMVDTQLSQADSAMKDSLKAFEQFRMETEKRAVPGMHEIAPDGNYTGSGAKLLDTTTSDEETS